MKRFFIILLAFCLVFICGCESYAPLDEINGVMGKNDIAITLKANTDSKHNYTIAEITESDGEKYLKIDVQDGFSLRGKAAVQPGKRYKLSLTMKNDSADPVAGYSFWKDSVTTTRNFTLAGENGNPPVSKTQELYGDWTAFSETFEAEEKEIEFMLTLSSGKGVFYIKDLSVEDMGA